MIVKFQRPLFEMKKRRGSELILIYDKDRNIDTMCEMTRREIKKIFPRGVYRIFYECEIENKMLNIKEYVPDQDW